MYYNTLFGCSFSVGQQHVPDNWLRKNFSTSRPGNLPGWVPREPKGTGSENTINSVRVYDNADTQKEGAILFYIQKKLAIGTVKHFPQGKSGKNNDFYRLFVRNPSHILLLAFLFNGNLALTHRIQQSSLWVQALNKRFSFFTFF